jgi:hypothetical protein
LSISITGAQQADGRPRYNLAQPGVAFSSEIPREAKADVERLASEYEKGLLNLIEIARLHETPIVFLTTHRRPYHPAEPPFSDGKTPYAAYKGKYLLAGFQHRVVDLTNDIIRAVCRREGARWSTRSALACCCRMNCFKTPFIYSTVSKKDMGNSFMSGLSKWGFDKRSRNQSGNPLPGLDG